jgi:ribonucleoside-triphosphate reductase
MIVIMEGKMDDSKRTKCERYARIVGYLRPLSQWNEGKAEEWKDRKMFKIK